MVVLRATQKVLQLLPESLVVWEPRTARRPFGSRRAVRGGALSTAPLDAY
jgi:hypothetical protein